MCSSYSMDQTALVEITALVSVAISLILLKVLHRFVEHLM